jgi:DNA-binding Lrp family transcriptional regulator
LAEYLNSDEETVLKEIRGLKEAGIVRRVGAFVNYRALGFAGTLAAAHVPANKLRPVTEAVNSLDGVSHNYLRKHHYNLWFTLQGRSAEEIERTLAGLSERFDIGFHSLPVERVFKLDVRFDLEGEDEMMLEEAVRVPREEVVKLGEKEKRILSKLQDELEIKARPFDFLCKEGLGEKEVLRIIGGLVDKGVIRRIGGVVDHRKLGYTANVMFCCAVGKEDVAEAGERLAGLRMVSHCYERRALEDWPYNLYAMLHGRSMGEIQQAVARFVESEKIDSFELLATEAELKKRPVRHKS